MNTPRNFLFVTDEHEITAAQRRLEEVLRAAATWTGRNKLGYQGGNTPADVGWVDAEKFWFACLDHEKNRWNNGFGVQDPRQHPNLSIAVWINPPRQGAGKQGRAAFLRDEEGRLYLGHSGGLGGGKPGVGKRAFLEWLGGDRTFVGDREFVLVSCLDSPEAVADIAKFVRKVDAFKKEVGDSGDEDQPGDSNEEGEDADADVDPGEDIRAWLRDTVLGGYSSDASRGVALQWFADAVRLAHAQRPTCWAVTRRPRRLRLLVGETAAFDLGLGRFAVGVHLPTVPHDARASIEPDTRKDDFEFVHIDGGVLRRLSEQRFLQTRETLQPAGRRFIELAAARFPNSPFARHHVQDLVDEIGRLTGQSLPRPIYRGGNTAPSYWKVAPGEKARRWPQCRDGGYIAIGWDELGDLSGMDRDAFDVRLDATLLEHPTWKRRGVEQVWRFVNIPVGARIVANDGTRRVVGIGTVLGPYQFVEDDQGFAHRLPVRWDDVRPREVEELGWVRTVIQLSAASFGEVLAAPSPGEVPPEPRPEAKPAEKLDFGGIIDRLEAAGLQFPDELVASYLLALQAKRFVILSGISGTGKTQLALATALAFQPTGAGVAAPAPARPDVHQIRVQPYMLKFRRMVIPAVLWDSIKEDTPSGSVTVCFAKDRTESLRISVASTATQLLFKGGFREWFNETFEAGDEMNLLVEGEDPLVLRIEPVIDVAEIAARPATYEVVAVRPDWTDNRGLLGYYNPITRDYQTTPFLRILLAAADDEMRAVRDGRPRQPYFVVLDEMNLARVEHYFSDFLSCLESGEPLHLHDDALVAEGESADGQAVPMRLPIPRNLFFTGTVNVDETTYMFSPKVLDRAFVLEFNDVDLQGFGGSGDEDETDVSSPLRLGRFEGSLDIRERPDTRDWKHLRELADGAFYRALVTLNDRLAAENRHFGYRVANEIARFVGLAGEQAGKDPAILWAALDVAIVAKILPKLHGTQQEIEDVLARLLGFAVDVESAVNVRGRVADWDYVGARLVPRTDGATTAPRLPRSAAKLWRMLRRVGQQGYVSFIE